MSGEKYIIPVAFGVGGLLVVPPMLWRDVSVEALGLAVLTVLAWVCIALLYKEDR